MSKSEKLKNRINYESNMLLIAIIAIIILAVYVYGDVSQKQIEEYARYAAQQNVEEVSKEVDAYLSYAFSSIELTSHLVSQTMTDKVLTNANEVLESLLDRTPFNFIEYIEQDGTNTTAKGEQFDASDRVYYKEGIKGNTGIWINFHPKYSDEYLLDFYTPLYYEDEIVGVLTGTMGADTDVLPMLSTNFFGERMFGVLCDENVQLISSSIPAEGDVTIEALFDYFHITQEDQREFYRHVEEKDSNVFEFTGAYGKTIACVSVNDSTGWCIVQIVPSDSFQTIVKKTAGNTYFVIGIVAALLLIYLGYMMLQERKREKKMQKENEQKIAEQIILSNTDKLTGIYNRRSYEDDIKHYPDVPPEEDFIYMSADVNGLKAVNDTLGHAAGDELLKGAAECMQRCIGAYGRIYRIGGDEFAAMIFANSEQLEFIRNDLEETIASWCGEHVKELSISCGFVSKREFSEKTVTEMAGIADERMYAAKSAYYMNKGVDRRGQQTAYRALCESYTKILKINLTRDTYKIICMEISEQSRDKGFSEQISVWLHDFGTSGQVHKDDLEEYLEKTNLQYLRSYFTNKKGTFTVFYKRFIGNAYRQAMMEMLPAEDYTEENQSLYLYVKDIDK